MLIKKFFFIREVFFFLLVFTLTAQAQPFANEIAGFKKQDSLQAPPKNAILFVGSSSFRLWPNIQTYFPSHTIINRGFGGSSLPDVIRYTEDIIFPYEPKQIVIYCGENDIASSDTITAEIVLARVKNLFQLIRTKMPQVPILFVSIKPSPSRWHLKDTEIMANDAIKKYLKKQKHARFVSVWNPMLGPDGKPLEDIFVQDKLHMNAKGYAIWQKIIEPHLLK
jgi:lysophospholipase L1-like esterase